MKIIWDNLHFEASYRKQRVKNSLLVRFRILQFLRASCLFILKSHTSLSKHYFLKLSAVGIFPEEIQLWSLPIGQPLGHTGGHALSPKSSLEPHPRLGSQPKGQTIDVASPQPVSAWEDGERSGVAQGSGRCVQASLTPAAPHLT